MKVTATVLNTVTASTGTQPGYLIEIQMSPVLRLSTLGDVQYSGQTYSGVTKIDVSGINQDGSGGGSGTVTITDPTDTFATLFLGSSITAVPVRIYATDRGVFDELSTDPNLAVLVFSGSIGGIEIHEPSASITLELISFQSGILHAPRRTIGPETGFTRLIPTGTEIKIGSDTYRLERK